MKRLFGSGSFKCYRFGKCSLWLIHPDQTDDDVFPVEKIDRLYVVEAHRVDERKVTELRTRTRPTGRVVVQGQFSLTSHWFYQFCRADGVKLHRVSSGIVTRLFPDQEQRLEEARKRYDKLAFQRYLELEDIDISASSIAFTRYARERLIIRDRTANLIKFVPTALQQRYLAIKRQARIRKLRPRFLVLKPRREGITTMEQAISYQDTATKPNRMNVTLSHLDESTRRIFRIAKLFHEKDPYAPELRSSNSSQLEFPALNSLFFIGTAGSRGFGRGDTLQNVHGSEVAKWCIGPHQMEKVADLLAGLQEAASAGSVTLETTANGCEAFYQLWSESKKGLNDWNRIYLRWFDSSFNTLSTEYFSPEQVQDTLIEEEKDLIKRFFGYDPDKPDLGDPGYIKWALGRIAWRRMKKRELKELFKQEYPEGDDESCFLRSGTPYFDLDVLAMLLEKMSKNESHSGFKKIPGGYEVMWEPPQKGLDYVSFMDTSEGLAEGDLSGIVVKERTTGRDCFAFHGRLSMDFQAKRGVEVSRMYNEALFGIERNNTSGGAVVAKAQQLGYRRLFPELVDRKGWTTDAQTRPTMLNECREFLNEKAFDPNTGEQIIKDSDLVDEGFRFKLQRDGKYAADPGAHDDVVIKHAGAIQMRHHAARRPKITVG